MTAVDILGLGIFVWICGTSNWKQLIVRFISAGCISAALFGTTDGYLRPNEMVWYLTTGIILAVVGWGIMKNKKESTC